jgi:hypothetical protein
MRERTDTVDRQDPELDDWYEEGNKDGSARSRLEFET